MHAVKEHYNSILFKSFRARNQRQFVCKWLSSGCESGFFLALSQSTEQDTYTLMVSNNVEFRSDFQHCFYFTIFQLRKLFFMPYYLTFHSISLSLSFQNLKNQIMTTNVWVEQVSALNGMGCEIFFPQMVNEEGPFEYRALNWMNEWLGKCSKGWKLKCSPHRCNWVNLTSITAILRFIDSFSKLLF